MSSPEMIGVLLDAGADPARVIEGSTAYGWARVFGNRALAEAIEARGNAVPLSPEDSAPLYVEMMGGAERILARGQELFNAGDYLLAMEIVNKLVLAVKGGAPAEASRPVARQQSHIRQARQQAPAIKVPEGGPMASLLKKLFGKD